MSYNVVVTPVFMRSAKSLAKKHRSLKNDLDKLIDSLVDNPTQGIQVKDNFYKIRMAITSKGKGKSGGARVFTYVTLVNETVYMAEIIDKADRDNISDKEVESLILKITEQYIENQDEEE